MEKTFGNSKGAVILFQLVINEPKLMRKVTVTLSRFNKTLNQLSTIDSQVALHLAKISLPDFLENKKSLPKEIHNFLCNVIISKYKEWLKEMDGTISYKYRKDYSLKKTKL